MSRVENLDVSVIKQVSHHARGLDALRDLARIKADFDQTERGYVKKARKQGATWLEIGQALGITQQGAHKRFAQYEG